MNLEHFKIKYIMNNKNCSKWKSILINAAISVVNLLNIPKYKIKVKLNLKKINQFFI